MGRELKLWNILWYLYKHAVLSSLFTSCFEVFLQSLLLRGYTLQLGGVVRHQLIAGLTQLPLLAVQRLQPQTNPYRDEKEHASANTPVSTQYHSVIDKERCDISPCAI